MSIGGSVICKADCVRDLGLLVDPDLKFMAHINSVVSRAYTRSNLIFKCFVSRDRTWTTLVKSFTTYVRPLVEYPSPVWSPGTLTAIYKIETVQRRFTKRIPGLHSYSYHTRLTLLSIESLEARRLKADLLYVYKILFQYVDVDSEHFFCVILKLYTDYCRVNVRKHFFCNRIVAVWNALKINPCDIKTLRAFKFF